MASFDKFLTKVFGSSNQRFLKTVNRSLAQINEFEPAIKKLTDENCARKQRHSKNRCRRASKTRAIRRSQVSEQEVLDEILARSFCNRARSQRAHHRHAPFRCAVDWRPRAAPGQDCRDANGRRQDPGGDAAMLI